jgi:hypothetical protein
MASRTTFRTDRGSPMRFYYPVVIALVFTLLSTCNSPVFVESRWTDAEITFDADPSSWKDITKFPEDPEFGIGVRNDGTFLYLHMISWKHSLNSRILHFGFTTWFESRSKKGKRFGIHFPFAMAQNPAAWRADMKNAHDPEAERARIEESLQEMELLGPGKSDSIPVKTKIAESFGIVVRLFPSDENLVYEMKVPLRQDSVRKYTIDIGQDTLMNVTFEYLPPEIERPRNGGGSSMNGPGMGGGGGIPGGGEGMHGAGGMRGGGGMHEGGHARSFPEDFSDPFHASFAIRLAGRPDK